MVMWLLAAVAHSFVGREDHAADLDCVRRLADGDNSAVGALYDRHASAIYSLALRILEDEAEAEDVVQEVFAQAWRQAGRDDTSRGSVAAWLLVMTRTRSIDRVRARRARPEGQPAADEAALLGLQASAADVANELVAAEAARRVRNALNALPLLQRLAIELAYYEGLSQREIAERLEQPLGTVKTRIRLGLLKLRDELAGEPR
jgi:RNA polymerase sigma-70 factor, ECF subfamily